MFRLKKNDCYSRKTSILIILPISYFFGIFILHVYFSVEMLFFKVFEFKLFFFGYFHFDFFFSFKLIVSCPYLLIYTFRKGATAQVCDIRPILCLLFVYYGKDSQQVK